MYCTIRSILRYDTIHTIRTLYHTIYEYLRYADTIRNFLHTIWFVSYDIYRVSYDTDNYVHRKRLIHLKKKIWKFKTPPIYFIDSQNKIKIQHKHPSITTNKLNKRFGIQSLPTPKTDWFLDLMIKNYHQERMP